jgi:hypothetical protein
MIEKAFSMSGGEQRRRRRRKIEPIVTSDDYSTSPGLFAGFDLVDLVQTFTFIGSFQLLSQLVIADAAGVDNGVGREHVLNETRKETKNKFGCWIEQQKTTHRSSSCRVLGSTTSDICDFVVFDQFLVTI